MKILVAHRRNHPLHSTNFANEWIPYLKKNGIEHAVIDLLCVDNAIEIIKSYNALLYHIDNYDYQEMLEARSILYSAEQLGLKVFPGYTEAWHFDDKIAQMYALQACQAPIPKSWVFYSMEHLEHTIKYSEINYPIVGKLRTGSGSHNVKLIRSETMLRKYAKRMFGKGFDPSPSLLYKSSSNLRSTHDWKTFFNKLKRVPEFLRNLKRAKEFPNERGYVYLQEFIPNDGFDIKVVVIGNKLTGLHRPIRSHDFRASGGGECRYDKSLFTPELIETAFAAADALKIRCIGFDIVIDNRTNLPVIIEMSYGFSSAAILASGGYFDRQGHWHDEPVNAPIEILNYLLRK